MLLDPKNDYVFKRLFTQAPHLLVSLINAVRAGQPPIRSLEILNPAIAPEELGGKFIILDLLAQDRRGRFYDIEMQVKRYAHWGERGLLYLSRLLSEQLAAGADYRSLKPAVGIHLLDFELFKPTDPEDPERPPDQAAWCFELRDRHRRDVVLTEDLEVNLIELPKADRLGLARPELAAWVTFFEHWQEEARMSAVHYDPVNDAMSTLRALSADDEARRLAFVRERALRDERSWLSAERDEGRAEGERLGMAKGERLGMAKGKAATLLRLLDRRFGAVPEAVARRVTTADAAALDAWIDNFLTAADLDEVFH